MKTIEERFMNKVILGKDKINDCWGWNASKSRGGYGQFRLLKNNKWTMARANRVSYELFKGELSPTLLVCHSCDNPECINPNHLFTGTAKENIQDMIKKGRRFLSRNTKHKWLNRQTVDAMREDFKQGMKQAEICLKYEHSRAQVSRVVRNQIWK